MCTGTITHPETAHPAYCEARRRAVIACAPAANHAGAEIFLDTLEGRRRRGQHLVVKKGFDCVRDWRTRQLSGSRPPVHRDDTVFR
jgi:hypothetical protein